MAITTNFDDPYIKSLISNFSTEECPDSVPSTLKPILTAEADIENAKNYFDTLPPQRHRKSLEKLRKLGETIMYCLVGMENTREMGDEIGAICLEKTLAEMFLAGFETCDDRLKGNGAHDEKEALIDDTVKRYENITNTIMHHQQAEEQAIEARLVEESLSLYQNAADTEPLTVKDVSDDGEDCIVLGGADGERTKNLLKRPLSSFRGSAKKLKVIQFLQRPQATINHHPQPMASTVNRPSTSGSKSEFSHYDGSEKSMRASVSPTTELGHIYKTGVEVGYSDAGKKPIIIVHDPNNPDRVYTYRSMIHGSYRCSGCGLLGIHRYGKLYQGVFYANFHECEGKSWSTVKMEQAQRARKFDYVPLPDLFELSTHEDPRPYPAYPKQRLVTRPTNPNQWTDLIEYPNFETSNTGRTGATCLVAHDNDDPNKFYEYIPSSRGSFRCNSCLKHRKHTIAKIDFRRNILQSASHVCEGITRAVVDQTHRNRRTKTEGIHYVDMDPIELDF